MCRTERDRLGMTLRNSLRRVVDRDHKGLMVWPYPDGYHVVITNVPEGPIETTTRAIWDRVHKEDHEHD